MMLHTLHLVLEVLAVVAVWRQPVLMLRIVTLYLLLFDITGAVFVTQNSTHAAAFWYFYWIGRTAAILLLSALIVELLTRNIRRALRLFAIIWSTSLIVIVVTITTNAWITAMRAPQGSTVRMLGMNYTASLVCAAACVLALFFQPRNRTALTGAVLWVVSTALCAHAGDIRVYANLYPALSTLPLLAWTGCIFTSREKAEHDTRSEASARRQNCDGASAAPDDCGDRVATLQRARQGL